MDDNTKYDIGMAADDMADAAFDAMPSGWYQVDYDQLVQFITDQIVANWPDGPC